MVFKLHIIASQSSYDFIIIQANVDDRTPLKSDNFRGYLEALYGLRLYFQRYSLLL